MTIERPKLRKYAYKGDPLAEPPPEELASILEAHVGEPDALITVLEEVQRRFGFLAEQQLRYVARELGFPLARVFGVATFYNLFRFDPPGKHQVRVCRGTACHVNGSALILYYLEDELGIGVDETTADGLFTLQTVACVGACSLAAVVVIGDETHGRMTPDGTVEIIGDLARSEESA
jgi:NADH-quinone oxidoreductase subunit E